MKSVVIYNDQGVAKEGIGHTYRTIAQLEGRSPEVIDAATLLKGEWQQKTSLFIMPGGRDIFYHRALFPHGTRMLRAFVENGGTYLGFCAGAYFASSYIEFEKGGELEVCGERGLGFFPGTAMGPAYGRGEFRYENDEGARAAKITWSDGSQNRAYFHGGCLFASADAFENTEVLARYDDLPGRPAAIISCQVGKGRAILSGVHLEYSPFTHSSQSDAARQIYTYLAAEESSRMEVFKKFLMTNP